MNVVVNRDVNNPLIANFLISGLDKEVQCALINAIRRIIISEVKTQSIDTVDFLENSSRYPEEYIAHRLGLIPLIFQDSETTEVTIDAAGPCTVKSRDIIGVKTLWKKIPIVKLYNDERITLRMTIRESNGLEHSKWSPVSCVKVDEKMNIQIESVGQLDPVEIFNASVKILDEKLQKVINHHFVIKQ